jgi:hypothetical protein
METVILYASPFAGLLPLGVWLLHRKYCTSPWHVLGFHLVWINLFSMAGMALWYFSINNLPLLHLYTIGEATLLLWFYAAWLGQRFGWLNRWRTVAALFALLALLNAVLLQGWTRFNTLPRSVESILLAVLALLGFIYLLEAPAGQQKNRTAFFWVNSGILLYFVSALALFALSNLILPMDRQLNLLIWTIHACFSITMYACMAIGLWKLQRS